MAGSRCGYTATIVTNPVELKEKSQRMANVMLYAAYLSREVPAAYVLRMYWSLSSSSSSCPDRTEVDVWIIIVSGEQGNYVAVMCHSHKSKLFHYAAYVIHCWTRVEGKRERVRGRQRERPHLTM